MPQTAGTQEAAPKAENDEVADFMFAFVGGCLAPLMTDDADGQDVAATAALHTLAGHGPTDEAGLPPRDLPLAG